MAKLNCKGPENKGSKTGRGLGLCKEKQTTECGINNLGQGMGLRRNSGSGIGQGKRLKYNINNKKENSK